tara:strand:+ start:213 stop:533 length:321 start_codon:yes stop_codon:yes gene_type:complete
MTIDTKVTYRPLPYYLTIKESKVEGLGLFTTEDIANDVFLGVSHVKNNDFEGGYIRTPLGGFINHSDTPNCKKLEKDGIVELRTIKKITTNEELTLKYDWYKTNND